MTKKKEDLKKEFDYWVKRFNSMLIDNAEIMQNQQQQIMKLEEEIEVLYNYNKRTVHPNLVHLRRKVEKYGS